MRHSQKQEMKRNLWTAWKAAVWLFVVLGALLVVGVLAILVSATVKH